MTSDSIQAPSKWESWEENKQRMRNRKNYEQQIREELQMTDSLLPEYEFQFDTRLNRSRILESDEDNPEYGVY